MRPTLLALALLPLLATGCGGGSSDPTHSCTLTYSGGASESVWCDAPVVRKSGANYVLWVMAFRGAPESFDQAGQVTVSFNTRPATGTDYGWTGASVDAAVNTAVSFETRSSGGTDTHEALAGTSGAFSVRFSTIPATDGADPGGFDGIGTVHGTWTATLVPTGSGSNVTVAGAF